MATGRIFAGLSVIVLAIDTGGARAQAACEGAPPVEVVALDGAVSVEGADGAGRVLALGDRLCPGDVVNAGEDGRVELRFAARETTIGLARNSTLRIPEAGEGPDAELSGGMLRFISSVRDFFSVGTRHANAGIDGTEAIVAADAAAGTLVLVAEGDVTLTARAGGAPLALSAGTAGIAAPDAPARPASAADVPAVFRPLLVEPAAASDWAIHYPPVLLAGGAADAALAEAARALEAGDPDRAERLLAGRTEPRALALSSVVAVFRNRPDEGLALAARAIEADPGLGAAHVAESYALQAAGRVDAALAAAGRAAAVAPEDAFALARLAELHFIAGDAPRAGRVAERSIAVRPTSLGHAVKGFADLQANDYEAAETSFAAARAIDSEDPLPRIGEGLLLIRQGRTEEGRRALELAASLDPRRAAIRTLLGRAYDQEGLGDKALSQFDLAAERDPDDPQPWLSAAEVLFAQNRPVEALRRIQSARERAEGRAVLRSAAGLTEDSSIHRAALGRVYETLGFSNRAIQTGAAAAEQDPANAAARRILADVLGSRPEADIAQASSAFAAYVYDAPSKAPVQPSLAESNLAIFDGPAASRPSFAELSPFYEADGFRADLAGFGGTQSTWGDEASFTALHRGFALGIGQFHYSTDGYRFNNEVRHDIVDVRAKMQVLPMLDLFANYRYRNTDAGDRTLEFDLSDGDPTLDDEDERNLFRFGGHARIGANHDVAAAFTYVRANEGMFSQPSPFVSVTTAGDSDTYDGQAQHVGRFGAVTTVAGVAYTDFKSESDSLVSFGAIRRIVPAVTLDAEHFNAYGYATWRLRDVGPLAGLELTGGLSLDSVDLDGNLDHDKTIVSPKLGLRAEIVDGFALRGAFTRSVTPVQTVSERLEPMTVAGFTQFIDQIGLSDVWQGGVGFDAELTGWLSVGAEAVRRRIEQPEITTPFEPEITETGVNAYVNATLGDRLAGTLDFRRLASDGGPGSLDLARYEASEVAAGLGWFHPSGFFARGRAGVGWHSFTGANGSDSDTFPVTEISLGYRLPDERGILSLDLLNVSDADFGFEDRPIEAGGTPAATPRYARDFTALARLRLKF